MKLFRYAVGIIGALACILICILSSVDIVINRSRSYFENEYEKYQVAEAIGISMPDLMIVTDEMMDYLNGKRDNLVITTSVKGLEREFFNQREKDHMVDVKNLFLIAYNVRIGAVFVLALSIAILIFTGKNWTRILSKAFIAVTGICTLITIGLSLFISTNFTKYFNLFHEIFFDNDLWILNPNTDLLVNIVPEPFFVDTAFRIAAVFVTLMVIVLILCGVILRYGKKKESAAGASSI